MHAPSINIWIKNTNIYINAKVYIALLAITVNTLFFLIELNKETEDAGAGAIAHKNLS